MSLIHYLILGHFDIRTFSIGHPVPLRSLDVQRTQNDLAEAGVELIQNHSIHSQGSGFAQGYCVLNKHSGMNSTDAETVARSIAKREDCFVLEKGSITFQNPFRGVLAAPVGYPDPRDEELGLPLCYDEAVACRESGETDSLRRIVLRAARMGGEWAEAYCLSLISHQNFHVRGNAYYALTVLVASGREIAREVVQPSIEAGLGDPHPYVSGQAFWAARTVEDRLLWVIDSFGNGNPAMDAYRSANSKRVKCPNCNWMLAAGMDFREETCIRCRQKLRVHDGAC